MGRQNLANPYTQAAYSLKKEGSPLSAGPAPKVIRYVALGDSLTVGIGVSDFHQAYPYLFAQQLLKESDEVILIDLARPGARSLDLLRKQLPEALIQNPDYVSVLIGINDVQGLLPVDQFRKNYQTLLDELHQKTHAKVILMNIPNLGSDSLVVFPYNLLFGYQTEQYNRVLSELSKAESLPLTDIYSLTKQTFSRDRALYSADLFHPSAQGYMLWGQLLDAN